MVGTAAVSIDDIESDNYNQNVVTDGNDEKIEDIEENELQK